MTNAEASTAAGTATAAPQGAAVGPASTKGTHQGHPEGGRAQGQDGRETRREDGPGHPKETASKQAKRAPKPPEGGSAGLIKEGAVIELLRRKEGVAAAEIAKRTDWQPHTIRSFFSTISKKMKLAIQSVRNEQGQRVYRVK